MPQTQEQQWHGSECRCGHDVENHDNYRGANSAWPCECSGCECREYDRKRSRQREASAA